MEKTVQEIEYSIIVPVYKAEKTLKKCIESVLAQTFCKFELILVDDGSPDKSGEICDDYCKRDSRIRVIHQNNKGVSAARNSGIKAALGKYIFFIDSDDYIDNNYFSTFENNEGMDKDLVICNYILEAEDGTNLRTIVYPQEKISTNILKRDEIVECYKKGRFNCVWGKRFKREVIIKHKIMFDSFLLLGEDTVFVLEYLCHIKTIDILPNSLYHYVRYNHSTLSNGLLSRTAIQRSEECDSKVYKIAKRVMGEEAEAATAYRSALTYRGWIGELLDGNYDYKFYRYILRQEWYKKSLEFVDEIFELENYKFRKILRTRSAMLLYIFSQYRRLTNGK